MQVKPFFVFFPVLVGVVIYGYYSAGEKPEGATTLTPKEYIEMVEKKKAERRKQAAAEKIPAEAPLESAERKLTEEPTPPNNGSEPKTTPGG
jgi:hypothetical protein